MDAKGRQARRVRRCGFPGHLETRPGVTQVPEANELIHLPIASPSVPLTPCRDFTPPRSRICTVSTGPGAHPSARPNASCTWAKHWGPPAASLTHGPRHRHLRPKHAVSTILLAVRRFRRRRRRSPSALVPFRGAALARPACSVERFASSLPERAAPFLGANSPDSCRTTARGSHSRASTAPGVTPALTVVQIRRQVRLEYLLPGTLKAGATGLEPATSGVTGRRSDQLNYAPGSGRSVATAGNSRCPPNPGT